MTTNLFNDGSSNFQNKPDECLISDVSDVIQKENKEIFGLTIMALSFSMMILLLFA
ncbi:hypothetical protein [Crocosphaera sp. Alani8]|uniref:hypothetical protein n=1 Tax=Crocosphaera sp. Alani8 TaxID=3038952 RepID=UPI00313AA277